MKDDARLDAGGIDHGDVGGDDALGPQATQAAQDGGSVLATASRRTPPAARESLPEDLAGVPHEVVRRGQELAMPGYLKPSKVLTVRLHAIADARRPIKHRL